MAVYRDSDLRQDLLRPHRKAASALRRIGLDENVSAALDQMLSLSRPKYVALRRCGIGATGEDGTGHEAQGAGKQGATVERLRNHDEHSPLVNDIIMGAVT